MSRPVATSTVAPSRRTGGRSSACSATRVSQRWYQATGRSGPRGRPSRLIVATACGEPGGRSATARSSFRYPDSKSSVSTCARPSISSTSARNSRCRAAPASSAGSGDGGRSSAHSGNSCRSVPARLLNPSPATSSVAGRSASTTAPSVYGARNGGQPPASTRPGGSARTSRSGRLLPQPVSAGRYPRSRSLGSAGTAGETADRAERASVLLRSTVDVQDPFGPQWTPRVRPRAGPDRPGQQVIAAPFAGWWSAPSRAARKLSRYAANTVGSSICRIVSSDWRSELVDRLALPVHTISRSAPP